MECERMLLVLEYLTRCTDDTRGVTLRQICAYLDNNYQLQHVSPLTVQRDLDRLGNAGYEITMENGAHNTHYYRLRNRGFTLNEIRFLVDSVSMNHFLTPEQKQHLIRKFEQLCSEKEVRQLMNRIQIAGMVPPDLDLLRNLEQIYAIMAEKRKIHFSYGKMNPHKQVEYVSKDRNMIPCQVLYFQERFYLKCRNGTDGTIRTYRVDRMQDIRGGASFQRCEPIPKPDGAVVDIFEPEQVDTVVLRVRRYLLDDLLKRFGSYASAVPDPEKPDFVQLRVRMCISKGFPRWALRYGADLEVLRPEALRRQVREKVQAMAALYSPE